jgi:hypothetical protein
MAYNENGNGAMIALGLKLVHMLVLKRTDKLADVVEKLTNFATEGLEVFFVKFMANIDAQGRRGWLWLDMPVTEERELVSRMMTFFPGSMRLAVFQNLLKSDWEFLVDSRSEFLGLQLMSLLHEISCSIMLRNARSCLVEMTGAAGRLHAHATPFARWGFMDILELLKAHGSIYCPGVEITFEQEDGSGEFYHPRYTWLNREVEESDWLSEWQNREMTMVGPNGDLCKRLLSLGVSGSSSRVQVYIALRLLAAADTPYWCRRILSKRWSCSRAEWFRLDVELDESAISILNGYEPLLAILRRSGFYDGMGIVSFLAWSDNTWGGLWYGGENGENALRESVLFGLLEEVRWGRMINLAGNCKWETLRRHGGMSPVTVCCVKDLSFAHVLDLMMHIDPSYDVTGWLKLDVKEDGSLRGRQVFGTERSEIESEEIDFTCDVKTDTRDRFYGYVSEEVLFEVVHGVSVEGWSKQMVMSALCDIQVASFFGWFNVWMDVYDNLEVECLHQLELSLERNASGLVKILCDRLLNGDCPLQEFSGLHNKSWLEFSQGDSTFIALFLFDMLMELHMHQLVYMLREQKADWLVKNGSRISLQMRNVLLQFTFVDVMDVMRYPEVLEVESEGIAYIKEWHDRHLRVYAMSSKIWGC